MVVSGVVGTLELEVEHRSSADKFWETLKTWSSVLPEVLPETFKCTEVIEDASEQKNGFVVTIWKINPSTLVEGAPVMMEVIEKVGNVNEETKTITYSVIGGDLLELYKSYEGQFTVAHKSDGTNDNGVVDKVVDEQDKKDGKSGGGILKWSVKYEKVDEMVPEPYMIKAIIYKTVLKLDEYILSRQITN